MAISSEANGSQTAVLTTIHPIGSEITTAGCYQLHIDANALVANEVVTPRAAIKVLSGGTARYVHAPSVLSGGGLHRQNIVTPVFPIAHSLQFSLEQNNGTGRAFNWEIVDLGNTSVAEANSNTSAPADRTQGVFQTLDTRTDGKTYVLYIDIDAQTVTEDLEIEISHKIRSAGTTRVLWHWAILGEQGATTEAPIIMSPPIPALHEVVFKLKESNGTERSYPWSLVTLD